ncbi:MAG: PIN domain-containing protein [Bryobacteraceae bacterium]
MAIRTFLDTCVLIAARRGEESVKGEWLAILNEGARHFIASPFLYLKTMPKAVYHQRNDEIAFYRSYFDKVSIWINDVESIFNVARNESESCGLGSMDALHVATAYLAKADVLYTLERKEKPIYRTALVRVVSVEPVRF